MNSEASCGCFCESKAPADVFHQAGAWIIGDAVPEGYRSTAQALGLAAAERPA